MPQGSHASLRYFILDKCFSNTHHRYTIDELLDIINEKLGDKDGCSINIRQLRKDIHDMRDRIMFNAPIKAYPMEGRECYYRYSDPEYSVFNNGLSSEEADNLYATIEMLNKYRGIPANAWIEEVISSLEYRVIPTDFSFIPDIEVISPQWLRDEIIEKMKENLIKYLPVQNDCTDTNAKGYITDKRKSHRNR